MNVQRGFIDKKKHNEWETVTRTQNNSHSKQHVRIKYFKKVKPSFIYSYLCEAEEDNYIRKGTLGENNDELRKIGVRDDGKEYSKINHVIH
jgi:hypothetical protein